MRKLRILLVNDDGFMADGLQKLYSAIKDLAEVTIVAPDSQRSAVGHGITMYRPLRAKQMLRDGRTHWMVDGTPADCVKLGVEKLLANQQDLVIAGINAGSNVGSDLFYSGTVAAAIEGFYYKIPSIALSLASDCNDNFDFEYTPAATFVAENLEKLYNLACKTLLNVNFPDGDLTQAKVCFTKLGEVCYDNAFDERQDPRGKKYYWLSGDLRPSQHDPESDIATVINGNISISPLNIDFNNCSFLKDHPSF